MQKLVGKLGLVIPLYTSDNDLTELLKLSEQNQHEDMVDDEPLDTGHAVYVSSTCPHTVSLQPNIPNIIQLIHSLDKISKCNSCDHNIENWMCLSCGVISCGRNIQAHAHDHHSQTSHPIATSLADLSCWCYLCNTYIENNITNPVIFSLHQKKFSSPHPKEK